MTRSISVSMNQPRSRGEERPWERDCNINHFLNLSYFHGDVQFLRLSYKLAAVMCWSGLSMLKRLRNNESNLPEPRNEFKV